MNRAVRTRLVQIALVTVGDELRLRRLTCGKPLAFRRTPGLNNLLRAGWKAQPSSLRGWPLEGEAELRMELAGFCTSHDGAGVHLLCSPICLLVCGLDVRVEKLSAGAAGWAEGRPTSHLISVVSVFAFFPLMGLIGGVLVH